MGYCLQDEDKQGARVHTCGFVSTTLMTDQVKPPLVKPEQAEGIMEKVCEVRSLWSGKYWESRPSLDQEETFETRITEVPSGNYSRTGSPEMNQTTILQTEGLIERGMFEVFVNEELPISSNVLGVRSILALNDSMD